MRWHELTVNTTEEAIEMVTNFIHELGAGGVSIEESGTLNKERDTSYGQLYDKPFNDIPEGRAVIKGYFSTDVDMVEVLEVLKERVNELKDFNIDTGAPTYDVREVDDEDWADAWKQYFKPMRISDRLTIKPTWEEYEASPGEIILELDPGMAFGTGTHATTSLCLKALEKVIAGDEDVIDVGTGSGVLSIAAAKLGARQVLAVDLDPVAVTIAGENTSLNGLDSQITTKLSDLLGVLKESESGAALNVKLPVQVVVANILAEIILLFIDDVYQVLESGGRYITSGIIISKEQQVVDGLVAAGFEIEEKQYDGDWVVLIAKKR
ncbi:50S ribosomal protein L11 methyltransferase [Paenibacillus sp. KN14-4R]|uniref:50S ribosomal protein L11 methyltransferase n=1 Tax=Paenibacillus sp. KN14-4R TaxID=3445773 RepID=UPI003FA17613